MPHLTLRRIRLAAVLGCVLPLLGGCFTFDTTVRLSPDGSGTIEREFVLTGEMASMLRAAGAAEERDGDLCEGQELGEGVRLLSSDAIDDAERFGCRQVYAFADINTLRLSPNPDESLTDQLGSSDDAPEAPITFDFTPGSPATLVVHMPPPELGDPDEETPKDGPGDMTAEDEAGRAMALAMMREMLRGSRYSLQLVLPGTIVETDATHAEGDRVTLVELDFDALLEEPEHLERLMEMDDPSSDEARALLARTPGIRFEQREEVTIRFR